MLPPLGKCVRVVSTLSAHQSHDQADDEDDQENEEQDLGNFGGARGDAAEAEDRSDDCNHEEDCGGLQHGDLLWLWARSDNAPSPRYSAMSMPKTPTLSP